LGRLTKTLCISKVRALSSHSLLVTLLVFITSCASTTDETTPTTVFLDDENQIHYVGELNEESNQLLYELYETAEIKPETLVFTSGGGRVDLGLDIGEWLHDHDLNIVIERFCFSSCANYIFTAASQKYLKKDSVVGWHGSSWQESMEKLYQQGDKYVIAWREREASFFKKIGVDYRITVYGFSRYTFWDRLSLFIPGRQIQGFNYSIEDMEKFGVTDVHLIDGEWNWQINNKDFNVKRAVVENNAL
jgi:hypothetical protein